MRVAISMLKHNLGDRRHFQLAEKISPETGSELLELVQPVKVSLDITNCGAYLQAQGTIVTVIKLNCGRCLKAYEYLVETEFNENYYPVEVRKNNQKSISNKHPVVEDDDLEISNEASAEKVFFSGNFINVEPEVFSSIQLSLPMRQVCSEECRGLCSECGINLNDEQCDCQHDELDPRMAALQKLFNK